MKSFYVYCSYFLTLFHYPNMSSSRTSSSSNPTTPVKVDIQDQTSDQISVLSPRPIIVPSTHSLHKMMKMASNSQGVAKDYMETVDLRDIVSKAGLSVLLSSRLTPQSKGKSIWQIMSSPYARLPYRTLLWSLLLRGLATQAEWFKTWAMLLHEAQIKNIFDSNLLIEIQALRNALLMLVLPPMSLPCDNFSSVMIERDCFHMPLIEQGFY